MQNIIKSKKYIFFIILILSLSFVSADLGNITVDNQIKNISITKSTYSFYNYETNGLDYKAYFRNNSGLTKSVSFVKNGYYFTFDIANSQAQYYNSVSRAISGNALNPLNNNISINKNIINYSNAWTNSTLVYVLDKNQLKEAMVINNIPKNISKADFFRFKANIYYSTSLQVCVNSICYLHPSNLVLNTTNEIDFKDSNNKTIFYLPQLMITDANGKSVIGTYFLNLNNGIDLWYLGVPTSFLRDAIYPINFDPTILIYGNTSKFYYEPSWADLNITLEKNVYGSWTAIDNISFEFINNTYKLNGLDNSCNGNCQYRWKIASNVSINKNSFKPYITNGYFIKDDLSINIFIEKHYFDFSSDCNKTNAKCSFFYSSGNGKYSLSNVFYSNGTIDPVISVSESTVFGTSTAFSNVKIVGTSPSFAYLLANESVLFYSPFDINNTNTNAFDYSRNNYSMYSNTATWNSSCLFGGCFLFNDYFNSASNIKFTVPTNSSGFCYGSPSTQCSSFGQTDCSLHSECSWVSDACSGSSSVVHCSQFTHQETCNNYASCTWSGGACIGNLDCSGSLICSVLGETDCSTTYSNVCNWISGTCNNNSCSVQSSCVDCTGICSGGGDCCSNGGYCNDGACTSQSSCKDTSYSCNGADPDCCNNGGYCGSGGCTDAGLCESCGSDDGGCCDTWYPADCGEGDGCSTCGGSWDANGCSSTWHSADCNYASGCTTCSGDFTFNGCCDTWNDATCETTGTCGDITNETNCNNAPYCHTLAPTCSFWSPFGSTLCTSLGCTFTAQHCSGTMSCSSQATDWGCSGIGCSVSINKMDLNNNFTISLWINPKNYPTGSYTNAYLVDRQSGTGGWNLGLKRDLLENHYIEFSTVGETNLTWDVPFNFVTNSWSNLVITTDNSTYYIYVNGTLISSTSYVRPGRLYNQYLIIGGTDAFTTGKYNGSIDDLFIKPIYSDSTEASNIYNNKTRRFDANGTITLNAVTIPAGNNTVNISLKGYQRLKGSDILLRIGYANSTNSTGYNESNLDLTSLVSWWRMDDMNGSTVNDFMTLNNGTNFSGAHQNSSGYFGSSFTFDGANDYIGGSNSGTNFPIINASRTITAWVKTTRVTNDQIILMYGNNNQQSFHLLVSNGKVRIGTGFGAGTIAGTSIIADGTWHFIAGTYNKTTNNLQVYADGKFENNGTSATVNTGTSNNWRIGLDMNGANSYSGSIDELMIYNKTLSSAEIVALYNGSSSSGNYTYTGYQSLNAIDSYDNSSVNTFTITNSTVKIIADFLLLNSSYGFYTPNFLALGGINFTTFNTTASAITINYPLNTTYNVNVSNINYTLSITNPSYCWYSNNSGVWNSSTVSAGTNFTNAISIEGSNAWTVYCNDTVNALYSVSVNFTKSTTSVTNYYQSVTDLLNINVITGRIGNLFKSVYQSFNINDILSRILNIFKSIVDSINFNVLTSRISNIFKLISDSLNINAITERIGSYKKLITDSLNFLDSIYRSYLAQRNLDSSLTISDFVNRNQNLLKSFSDNIVINDYVNRIILKTYSIYDSITINTFTNRVSSISRLFQDSINFNLIVSRTSSFFRSLSDIINIDVFTSRLSSFFRGIEDIINFIEGIFGFGTKVQTNPNPNQGSPPTSSVNYTNGTVILNNTLINEQLKNETIINNIANKGKSLNLITYLIIGIISFLILLGCILFERSKRKFSKDGLLFIITSLIFSVFFLIVSILYKDIYALSMLIIVLLIFMVNIIILLITKDNKSKFDIFGTIFIAVSLLVFSAIMIYLKNYLILAISLSSSILLIIIVISILIDRNLK